MRLREKPLKLKLLTFVTTAAKHSLMSSYLLGRRSDVYKLISVFNYSLVIESLRIWDSETEPFLISTVCYARLWHAAST